MKPKPHCFAISFMLLLTMTGCTHFAMKPCEQKDPLGGNEPGTARIRTSHHRAFLGNPAMAAGRLLPYALMSAYAYRLSPGCFDPGNAIRVNDERAAQLKQRLGETADPQSAWTEVPELSIHDPRDSSKVGCEDDEGLMYNVWERRFDDQMLVVVAFRGTSGHGDWKYGNLWWFTRFFSPDNQHSRSYKHMKVIIEYYEAQAASRAMRPPRFITTGHSLGGGLAQHMLYRFPDRVEQAIVFDPSSVTGYVAADQPSRVLACSCTPARFQQVGVDLGPEARILRVYQTYEILADLRIFHKMFFLPERHVQEIRFPFDAPLNQIGRHSMQAFADNLYEQSGAQRHYGGASAWLASADSACTRLLVENQRLSCSVPNDGPHDKTCPQ
jgi:pimeloyl-ACP methyl ester carboxylesterase